MGELGSHVFVAHDGVTIGAIMERPKDAPVSAWAHYFRVPGIAAAKAATEAGGGRLLAGPMEVPGGEWIIHGIDPLGAVFSLAHHHAKLEKLDGTSAWRGRRCGPLRSKSRCIP